MWQPPVWLVAKPFFCGGCWLLVGEAKSQGSWLWNPGSPWGYCWLTGGQSQGPGDSNTMWNKRGENRCPCLVPDLRGKAFNFSPLSMMLAIGLS